MNKTFKEKYNRAIDIVKTFLESDIAIPIYFDVMLLSWLFNLTYVCVFMMAVVVASTFLLCKNVRNVFVPIFYISFFLNDIALEANILLYGIAVGIVIIAIITFLVLKLVKEKKTLKKGNMFWAFVVLTVAFLLGGCIGNFNIAAFGALLGFCLISYFLYWVVLNFCDNFMSFIFKLMVYGGVYIIIVFIISNVAMGGLYSSIAKRMVLWIGAQHINTAALFIVFGIIGAFVVGYNKKFDYLYYLLALIMFAVLVFTYCRLMILLGAIAIVPLFVLTIKKSQKKMNFVWVTIAAVVAVAAFCAINWVKIENIVNTVIWKIKTGSNGREELWPWCWEKFKQYPIFGYGFVSAEPVPTVRNVIQLVLAHNTVLQWLTSLGVVGSVLMIYFYIKKYQIIFTKPLACKMFLIITLLVIELNGMLDQTATMDIFVEILTFTLIAACERETPNINKIKLFKKKNKRVD